MFSVSALSGQKRHECNPLFEPAGVAGIILYDFWFRTRPSLDGVDGTRKRPVFFWIKSSAKRAFGECLGSKRR
jgi:hypothetical protein